jgi:hypothetical protein
LLPWDIKQKQEKEKTKQATRQRLPSKNKTTAKAEQITMELEESSGMAPNGSLSWLTNDEEQEDASQDKRRRYIRTRTAMLR